MFLLLGASLAQVLLRSALLVYPFWRIWLLRLFLWPDMLSIATEVRPLENLSLNLAYNDWLVLTMLSDSLPERQWVALVHATNDRQDFNKSIEVG